jgi:hypothetical protein
VRAYEEARARPSTAEEAAVAREDLRRAGIVKLGIKRVDGRIDALGTTTGTADAPN